MIRGGRAGRRGWWPVLVILAMVLATQAVTPWDSRGLWAQDGNNADAELVYLDPDRVIRILDPAPAFEGLDLGWSSPEGGWKSFALDDVTGDTDDEIIAIRDEGSVGRLKIYDPVAVGSPDELVQYINEVPWSTLYDVELPGPPILVGTGEFDATRAGAEIIYAYALPPGERTEDNIYRFVILHAATESADGRAWEPLYTWNTDIKWTWLSTGNLDNSGIDEVALVANEVGDLSIFRVTNSGFVRIYQHSSPENEWRVAAFGQYIAGGAEELAAVRAADYPLGSAWIFQWADNAIADVYGETLIPSPRMVFWADIAGNGDQEIVMLRSVPQELGQRPRLIVRDNGNDTKVVTEAVLDGDSGYTTGVGGDFDGDGRDEFALARTSRIRIYTEPESSVAVEDHDLVNTADILLAGNLDGAGLARSPRLGASKKLLSFTVRAGMASDPETVRITDATTGSALPVVGSVKNDSSWINWSFSTTSTPVDVTVFANAAGLQPGVYVDYLLIDAQTEGVTDDPFSIGITLTVESGVTPTPSSLSFVYYPCEDPEVRTAQVNLSGEAGTLYSTQITGSPAWVSVVPVTGELPGAATVTVDPTLRPSDGENAVLVVSVDWPGAPDTQQKVPILLLCAHDRVLMPVAFGSN